MITFNLLISHVLHIDQTLFSFVSSYGTLTYVLLFVIIFAETGFVVTPFLPGDSLLFAAGSIAAQPNSALNIQLLVILLILASTLGNKINYLIGRTIGPKIFTSQQSRFFNKKYLMDAHLFYEKHGGKAILLARFIPIIRTFAPFVAGIGAMRLHQFSLCNIASAVFWVGTMLGAGYFLGTLSFFQNHFSLVIYSIVAISLLPVLLPIARSLTTQ
ncbi:MAG: hypothetical protein A3F43_00965 [Gammaproteobacteria bacterium RIFCSPHIGHO2_12_FULL_42_10]|nr:MAG: hypothetical protein A3F43_00965 [Gammaproteobacteria bacterium RIFCSPHIGHO2_12_FULL_42_10]